MPTDLELLEIELDTIWVLDERGRLIADREPQRPVPHMVIAASNDGRIAAIGSHVPDDSAIELRAVALSDAQPGPGQAPAGLARCARLLEDAVGVVEASSGPSYVIPIGTAHASSAAIRTSSDATVEDLREMNPPGANWKPDEWNLLLDGTLDPWAMATSGTQIIAICHSARLTERGAEAGVWTDPGYRGRGHAAAVTAAWASLLAGTGRVLFYSTSSDNASSQRVATRLNLRPTGWMWRLSPRQT